MSVFLASQFSTRNKAVAFAHTGQTGTLSLVVLSVTFSLFLRNTLAWAGSLRHTRFTQFLSDTSGLTARKLRAGGWGKGLLATLLVTKAYARAFRLFLGRRCILGLQPRD